MTESPQDPMNNPSRSQAGESTATSSLAVAVNMLTAPGEAFRALEIRPTVLLPLSLVVFSSIAVLFWYFSIVDFDWYVDDTLSTQSNLSDDELETAREAMLSMSPNMFKFFGIVGSTVGVLAIYLAQSAYLALTSALIGDRFRFRHWFSLVCWTNLPYMLAILGMVAVIATSPNGQISVYALNPLTLANLGFGAGNASLQSLFNVISLNMIWNVVLLVLGYRQWLQANWVKTLGVVVTPYLVIFGVWAYFAIA